MSQQITLEIADSDDVDVDELFIGYKRDGELHELAALEPPVVAELRKK